MRKQTIIPLAAAIVWIVGLAFVFQADLAGEISDGAPVVFSGTDRALAIAIDSGTWRSEVPPPEIGSWNEPLLRSRLRARVPELFPPDRMSWVHATHSGSSAEHNVRSGLLYLQFQYSSAGISASAATNILTRLGQAYIDELATGGIQATTTGAPVMRDADMRPLYLALMLVKSLAAALACLTLIGFLLWIDRTRLGMLTAVKISGALFVAGCLGLLVVQFEFVTTPQFAGMVPDSILLAQRISVTTVPPREGQSNARPRRAELDWKAVPESHFWRREMIRRDYPDITEAEASSRVETYPFDTAVLRGELLDLAPGWYFTLRVPKSLSDRIDPAGSTNAAAERAQRDAWLSMLFTHMKNGYEGYLATQDTVLASQGGVRFIYDYPLAPPPTRLRAGLILLISGLGLLCWLRRALRR